MELTRVNNDTNGNPRYVVHFIDLLTEDEFLDYSITEGFEIAVKRGKSIGGKKYRGYFGGGIVFQSYNTTHLQDKIREAVNEASKIGELN